jgi:hypothetical protein
VNEQQQIKFKTLLNPNANEQAYTMVWHAGLNVDTRLYQVKPVDKHIFLS